MSPPIMPGIRPPRPVLTSIVVAGRLMKVHPGAVRSLRAREQDLKFLDGRYTLAMREHVGEHSLLHVWLRPRFAPTADVPDLNYRLRRMHVERSRVAKDPASLAAHVPWRDVNLLTADLLALDDEGQPVHGYDLVAAVRVLRFAGLTRARPVRLSLGEDEGFWAVTWSPDNDGWTLQNDGGIHYDWYVTGRQSVADLLTPPPAGMSEQQMLATVRVRATINRMFDHVNGGRPIDMLTAATTTTAWVKTAEAAREWVDVDLAKLTKQMEDQ